MKNKPRMFLYEPDDVVSTNDLNKQVDRLLFPWYIRLLWWISDRMRFKWKRRRR